MEYTGVGGLTNFIKTRTHEGLPICFKEGLIGMTGRYCYRLSIYEEVFVVTIGAATMLGEFIDLQKFILPSEPTQKGFLASALGLGCVDGYEYQMPEPIQFAGDRAILDNCIKGLALGECQMALLEDSVRFTHLGTGKKWTFLVLSSQKGHSYLCVEVDGKLSSLSPIIAHEGTYSLLSSIYEGVASLWDSKAS